MLIKIVFKVIAQQILLYLFLYFTYTRYSEEKLTLKQHILLLLSSLGTSVLAEIAVKFLPKYSLYMISVLPLYLMNKFILKYPNSTTLVSMIMCILTVAASEMFAYTSSAIIFNQILPNYLEHTSFYFTYAIFKIIASTGIIWFLCIYINKHREIMHEVIENFRKADLTMIIVLSHVCILPVIFKFWDLNTNTSIETLALTTMQIFLFTTFIYIIFKYIHYYKLTKLSLEQSKLYNQTLTELVDSLRGLKHDYNNIIQAINGYILTEQFDELKTHMETLTSEANEIKNIEALNPTMINQPAIYGVLGSKYFKAEKDDVCFNINVYSDISQIDFDFTHLSRILGILLDNAIEASTKTEKPEITVKFSYNKRKNADMIEISNNVIPNLEIDLNHIFDKGISSKKVKSGLGLWEVRKIISSKKNSQIVTDLENDIFSQTLIIERAS